MRASFDLLTPNSKPKPNRNTPDFGFYKISYHRMATVRFDSVLRFPVRFWRAILSFLTRFSGSALYPSLLDGTGRRQLGLDLVHFNRVDDLIVAL